MSRDRVGPHPRAVNDPDVLLAAWTAWCLQRRATADPEAEFRSRWIWWDTPEGRFHREGTQLVERRSPGQPARVELHRGQMRRTLHESTVATWIARGRRIVPLFWTSSHRRIWFAPGGGQLEWQEWSLLDGETARTVALIDPGPELSAWWTAAETRAALGRKTQSPTWPDHALIAVRGWLDGALDDPALDLATGIELAHELAAADSHLAPVLLESVHAALERALARPSGASAARHPAWAQSLRVALDCRIRARPAVLQALHGAILRDLVLGGDAVSPLESAARLRALQSGLRASRAHVDARTGKIRRRLADLARARERRARAVSRDAWLVSLGQRDGRFLDADAAMEVGALRRRLDADAEVDQAAIQRAVSRLPRGRIRRLLHALPAIEDDAPTAPPRARKEEA